MRESRFYAPGTVVGGSAGPTVFGALVRMGSCDKRIPGCLMGNGLMVGTAVVEMFFGNDMEKRSLENVAPPLHAA